MVCVCLIWLLCRAVLFNAVALVGLSGWFVAGYCFGFGLAATAVVLVASFILGGLVGGVCSLSLVGVCLLVW